MDSFLFSSSASFAAFFAREKCAEKGITEDVSAERVLREIARQQVQCLSIGNGCCCLIFSCNRARIAAISLAVFAHSIHGPATFFCEVDSRYRSDDRRKQRKIKV